MSNISKKDIKTFHIYFEHIDPLEETDWIAINKLLNSFKKSSHVDLHYHDDTNAGENSWFIKINGILYHFTSLFDIAASFYKIEHNESLVEMILSDYDIDNRAASYYQDFVSIARILNKEILPYSEHKVELESLLADRKILQLELK